MAKRVISLKAQVQSMHAQWPQLIASTGALPETVVWKGPVFGLERSFVVSIEYGLPIPGSDLRCRVMPLVRVHSPALIPNWSAPEETPLPHVYFDNEYLERSALCLYDPVEHQWSRRMYIANTIVPWTGSWLACYEFWEASGHWYGGGRHPQLSSGT